MASNGLEHIVPLAVLNLRATIRNLQQQPTVPNEVPTAVDLNHRASHARSNSDYDDIDI